MTIDELSALRPEPIWSEADRADLLERILAEDRRPSLRDRRLSAARPARSRRLIAGGVIGLAVAAAVIVPVVVPSSTPGSASPAAAAALGRLAAVAQRSSTLGPNQFRHTVTRSTERGDVGCCTRSGAELSESVNVDNSWADAAGNLWQYSVIPVSPETPRRLSSTTFTPVSQQTGYPYSARYLDSLPTGTDALRVALIKDAKDNPDDVGDNAYGRVNDEPDSLVVFAGATSVVRSGIASPQLRAAAIRLLAHTPHVSLGRATTDSLGRPAVEFLYQDDALPGFSGYVYFDRRTAQILQVGAVLPPPIITTKTVVQQFDVVDAVPAAVRRNAH